jgi:hypothetical protein
VAAVIPLRAVSQLVEIPTFKVSLDKCIEGSGLSEPLPTEFIVQTLITF